MGKDNEEFCMECGEMAEFTYDGEQWICQKCGSYDSQGDFNESIPIAGDDAEQQRAFRPD